MKDIQIKPLEIIELEIDRLHYIAKNNGLSFEDTKKLETLIKTKQLILGEPTEIHQNNAPQITDAEILEALSPKEVKRGKKTKK